MLLYERLYSDFDPYVYVWERYNRELLRCLAMRPPSLLLHFPAESAIAPIINGWMGQLIWAFCIPRYNQGVTPNFLENLYRFIQWVYEPVP